MCISSHINLLAIIYSCICAGASLGIIIPTTIIFIGGCTYLYFNIYNQAIKPTLLEFIIFLTLTALIYTGSSFLFYQTFVSTVHVPETPHIQQENRKHFILRTFFN